jgi:hypothetical protein
MILPITSFGREGFVNETLFVTVMLSDDISECHKMPSHIKNMKSKFSNQIETLKLPETPNAVVLGKVAADDVQTGGGKAPNNQLHSRIILLLASGISPRAV